MSVAKSEVFTSKQVINNLMLIKNLLVVVLVAEVAEVASDSDCRRLPAFIDLQILILFALPMVRGDNRKSSARFLVIGF